MDINCILPCLHQINGKCSLIVVPDFNASQSVGFYENCDCAYFQDL